eukprot:scaffold1377_cov198-Ochromonas_danica.AAC.7
MDLNLVETVTTEIENDTRVSEHDMIRSHVGCCVLQTLLDDVDPVFNKVSHILCLYHIIGELRT